MPGYLPGTRLPIGAAHAYLGNAAIALRLERDESEDVERATVADHPTGVEAAASVPPAHAPDEAPAQPTTDQPDRTPAAGMEVKDVPRTDVQPKDGATTRQVVEGGGASQRKTVDEPAAQEGKLAGPMAPEAVVDSLDVPPSRALATVIAAKEGARQGFAKTRKEMAANPPSLERPSGMPRKEARAASQLAPTGPAAKKRAPAKSPGAPEEKPGATHVAATGPLPEPKPEFMQRVLAQPDDAEATAAEVEGAIDQVPSTDEAVNTDPGPSPSVPLRGESNPSNMQKDIAARAPAIDASWQAARADAAANHGENDIRPVVPKETLKGRAGTGVSTVKASKRGPASLSPDVAASFDEGAADKWGAGVAEAKAKDAAGKSDREKGDADAHATADAEIARLKDTATKEQLQSIATGKAEVAAAKAGWTGDLTKAEGVYGDKKTTVVKDTTGQIEAQKKDADDQARAKYRDARKEAEDAKKASEAEAEAEKKKKKSGGVLGWLKRKVKAALRALKKLVKAIFDRLRKLVKRIIEKVKKWVSDLIERVRRAIVGLLHLFERLLDAALDIFLFAFPEARKKAKAADWLKAGVQKALDALGKALDWVLAAYEKVIDTILDVIEFLAFFLTDMIEGLVRIARAASYVPDSFWGQFSEEGLGVDLTQPLPMEVPSEEAEPAPAEGGARAKGDDAVLEKDHLEDSDVGVDRVGSTDELDPAFFASLPAVAQGETVEFGETDAPLQTKAEAGAPAKTDAGAPPPKLSADEQIDVLIKQSEKPHTCDMPKTEDPAKAADVPREHRVFGPFSVGQRWSYYWGQIKQGIGQWWDCNWRKVVAAVAIGVIAFIALLILSGGAILALVPPALELLAVYFVGQAMVRAGDYVKDWISKGWNDDLKGGGKSLARGLVILLIELIFALMFNIGAVIKSIKGGLKGVARDLANFAKSAVKSTAKHVGRGVKAFVETGAAILKNGKLVFKGIGKGVMKGTRSLEDMARRLWDAVRLRKFRIRVSGGWFKLEGHFNPWVVLIEGPIDTHELVFVKPSEFKGATQIGAVGTAKVGGKDVKAVVVSGLSEAKSLPRDYRKIFEAWASALHATKHAGARNIPKDASDFVIHHVIEQQAFRRWSQALEHLMKNSPANFRAIGKGAVNEVIHLSRIRRLWDELYPLLEGLGNDAVRNALARYASFTEEFIDEMVKLAEKLSKAGLKDAKLKEALEEGATKFLSEERVTEELSKALSGA